MNKVANAFLVFVIATFFFLCAVGWWEFMSKPPGYRYTDSFGCEHYDDGKMKRIECGGKK